MTQSAGSLLDPSVQQCPFPFFRQLREEKPVTYLPDLGAYFVANYELAKKILNDANRFHAGPPNSDGRIYTVPDPAATQVLLDSGFGTPLNSLTSSDGATHDAYRGIVEAEFRVSGIRKLERYVAQITQDLIDEFAARGECEAVAEFCVPLPVFIIADMLGVPKSDYKTIKKWSDGFTSYTAVLVTEMDAVAGAEAIVEMNRYMLDQVRIRRQEPRDDLLTTIANGTDREGRPLSDAETLSMIQQILVAGNETTTNSMSASLLYLAENPQVQESLRAHPELIPRFVEEMLRLSTPLQGAMRFAIEDVEIEGVSIPAGSPIFVSLASANRDECKFEDAEAANTGRRNAGAHLTFGSGSHHCLGAELARLEMREAIRLWLERFSHFELNQEQESIEYPKSFALRGPLAVKLRFRSAA